MQQRLRNKVGLSAFILFLLIISATPLFAAEYSHVYEFKEPQIIALSNGRQVLEMEGTWPKDDIIGAPILPVKTSKMFIPANEKVVSVEIGYGTLKTIEGAYVIQHATTPYPLSHKGPFSIDEPDPGIYRKNAFHPSSKHRARKPQFLRGAQIVLVDLMPVLYNPVEGHLKYYQELEVRIKTEKRKKPDWVRRFRNSPQDRKSILRTIENKNDFLNFQPTAGAGETAEASATAEGPTPVQGAREYVVITTEGLLQAAQTLTAYRQLPSGGGYTTHIEDIADINLGYSGVDLAEKMRNFIRDKYLDPTYDTQYVVLLGDAHLIPTRGCYATVGGYVDNNVPSDLYFGCLDGTWNGDGDGIWGEPNDGEGGGDIDWESEVYVGRIPADNYDEAMYQINKIMAFETLSHPDKTLLVGEKLDATTWGGDRMDWVHSFMGPSPDLLTPATKLYDKLGTWDKGDLLGHINSNEHHWINHLGHSSVTYNMRLSNSDVNSMSNSKYLLVYTQGCYSGAFDYADCFGEAITNARSAGGAFAYIGNSRYGWYNPGDFVQGASNLAHKEFVEAIFTDNITKLGEANQESKTDLNLNSQLYRWIAFETNLFGCPATDLAARVCSLDSECDDGLLCNGAETCVANVCQPGTAPDCNDGVVCTVDSCDDLSGCVYTPTNSLCDDGQACNGIETCDLELDCQPGTPKNCDDGLDCTDDECNDPDGTCSNVADNLFCDNGLFCDGSESCDPLLGCQDGSAPCDPCDEGNDICPDCNNDGMCEAGEDCNNCPNDCISGEGGGGCGNGVCEPGEDCLSCPADCRGKQVGATKRQFCCGDGDGTNPVNCYDSRCGEEGFACTDSPQAPYCCGDEVCEGAEDGFNCEIDCGATPWCGDGSCDEGEDQCSCPGDCDPPPLTELDCSDDIDNDCDGATDCADDDCADSECPQCRAKREPCTSDDQCCSNWCRRGLCK